MSDSETTPIKSTSPGQPSEARLEDALRDAVKASFASGKTEEITVKRLRTIVEKELNLDQGFFKAHDSWNTRSKKIIQDAVNEHEEDDNDSKQSTPKKSAKPVRDVPASKKGIKRSSPENSEEPRKRTKPSPAPGRKSSSPPNPPNIKDRPSTQKGKKRPSSDVSEESRKRQKPSPPPSDHDAKPSALELQAKPKADDSGSELSEPPSELEAPPPRPNKVSKSAKAKPNGIRKSGAKKATKLGDKEHGKALQSEKDGEGVKNPNSATTTKSPPKASANDNAEDDSSDLSSLIDEEPAPQRRGRRKKDSSPTLKSKKSTKQAKANKSNKARATPAASTTDILPDEAEIKRLQSWLLKCGIRKMWHRELAPYSTPSAKVAHLKKMLKDVGMDGRYSVEKARAIKERRELEQDLEAVKEGEKRWGNRNGDDGSGDDGEQKAGDGEDEKPKRRLAKSLQGLEFLNDDDGEETD